MNKNAIVIGDILAIAILTIIGFATHDEMDISYLPRMAASFLPVLFAWFVLAPWFGLFDEEAISNPKHLLRIPLVFLFAAPLAVIIRSVVLAIPVIPMFALVLGSTNSLGMLVWRWLLGFITRRSSK
jgi:hypothetical protein